MSRGSERADGGGGKPRSRRGLLAAAAAGGLGVIAGETIAGATPALASNGQPVLQGTDNGTATARTAVLTANEMGVLADPGNTDGNGSVGVYGLGQSRGVLGRAATGSHGNGVEGIADGIGAGVLGSSPDGFGVWGVSASSVGVSGDGGGNRPGVQGFGGPSDGTGVSGTGGNTNGVGVEGFGVGAGTGVTGTGAPATGWACPAPGLAPGPASPARPLPVSPGSLRIVRSRRRSQSVVGTPVACTRRAAVRHADWSVTAPVVKGADQG